MSIEEKIRIENKEISESILKIIKNVKNIYEKKEQTELMKREIEKREEYDSNNIFKCRQKNENNINPLESENVSMIEYKESMFTRVIKKIKDWFIK